MTFPYVISLLFRSIMKLEKTDEGPGYMSSALGPGKFGRLNGVYAYRSTMLTSGMLGILSDTCPVVFCCCYNASISFTNYVDWLIGDVVLLTTLLSLSLLSVLVIAVAVVLVFMFSCLSLRILVLYIALYSIITLSLNRQDTEQLYCQQWWLQRYLSANP